MFSFCESSCERIATETVREIHRGIKPQSFTALIPHLYVSEYAVDIAYNRACYKVVVTLGAPTMIARVGELVIDSFDILR